MKGLIYKDLIVFKKDAYALIPSFSVIGIIGILNKNGNYITGIIVGMALIFTIIFFSNDSITNWSSFCICLPISKKKIVLARYISSFLVIIALSIISIIMSILINSIVGNPIFIGFTEYLSSILVAILFSFCTIPIIYKFGVEKARFLIIGVAGVFVLFVYILFIISKLLNVNLSDYSFLLILILTILCICYISFKTSVKIMTNKDW